MSSRKSLRRQIETKPVAVGGSSPTAKGSAVILVIVLTLVFLCYLNTLWFGFVHDDIFQVLGNTWLRSWKYLPRYFTADVWAFQRSTYRGTFYRPLFLLWFRLQYLVFGTSPWGWHLCTIYCHLAATLLAYYTAAGLLKDRFTALYTAIIFGLHPTHADAVAWVSGVPEPLSAVFLFGSYLCYLRWENNSPGDSRYRIGALVLYVFACLTKETAVVLPLIIFSTELLTQNGSTDLDARSLGRSVKAALKRALPYFMIFVVYLGARFAALRGFVNMKELHTPLSIVLTWPSVLWFYIEHLLYPVHIYPFYALDYYTQLDLRGVLLPAFLVILTAVVLAFFAKRSRGAAIAIVWMVVPILPVLDLRAFIDNHLAHDRYLYLPSFGFAMLVALGLRKLSVRSAQGEGIPVPQLVLVSLIAVFLGFETIRATACYADETTFAAYVARTEGYTVRSRRDVARQLWEEGHIDDAIKVYLEVWPSLQDDEQINYDLGAAYYLKNQLPEAEQYFARAAKADPNNSDAVYYLGITKFKLGDVEGGAADVESAISIRTDVGHYHRGLGIIRASQGNLPAALIEFRKQLAEDPDDQISQQQIALIEQFVAKQKSLPPAVQLPSLDTPPFR